MSNTFTHLEYRNAKIIYLVNKEEKERFIYQKKDITKEEAIEIVVQYQKRKQEIKQEKTKKEGTL